MTSGFSPSLPPPVLPKQAARPLRAFFLRAWQHKGLVAWALWPVSQIYGALTAMRRWAYRLGFKTHTRLPVPVVVVGNVVVGGTGKTPVTVALIQALQAAGYKPGVVSRGYGRQNTQCLEVSVHSSPTDVGDEPLLIHAATGVPLFVHSRRVRAAKQLLVAHPEVDVIVCDDGLQHLSLARDVELVLFDARGLGNGWLLPAGMLREPWPRRAKGATGGFKSTPKQIVLRTLNALNSADTEAGAEDAAGLEAGRRAGLDAVRSVRFDFTVQRALADYALDASHQHEMLETLQGQRVLALAGIAQPHQFFEMLAAKGVQPHLTIALPDHTEFEADLVAHLQHMAKNHRIVCTEKDAVKLWEHLPQAMAIPLLVSAQSQFCDAVIAELGGPKQG